VKLYKSDLKNWVASKKWEKQFFKKLVHELTYYRASDFGASWKQH